MQIDQERAPPAKRGFLYLDLALRFLCKEHLRQRPSDLNHHRGRGTLSLGSHP
jgi:hypothetical protein